MPKNILKQLLYLRLIYKVLQIAIAAFNKLQYKLIQMQFLGDGLLQYDSDSF